MTDETTEPADVRLILSEDRRQILSIEIHGRIVRHSQVGTPLCMCDRALSPAQEEGLLTAIRQSTAMMTAAQSVPVGEVVPAELRFVDPMESAASLASHRQIPPISLAPMVSMRNDRRSKGERRFPDPRRGRW